MVFENMKLVAVILFFCTTSFFCHAQEIVYLEEGREIKLLLNQNLEGKIGETVKFLVKYDVYTEDNLVIASKSRVKGSIVSKSEKGEFFVRIDKVQDVHGKDIEVRSKEEDSKYLKIKPNQSIISVYVKEGFWFSY